MKFDGSKSIWENMRLAKIVAYCCKKHMSFAGWSKSPRRIFYESVFEDVAREETATREGRSKKKKKVSYQISIPPLPLMDRRRGGQLSKSKLPRFVHKYLKSWI